MSATQASTMAPQFITAPLTGMQICRRLPLSHIQDKASLDAVWKAATQAGLKPSVRNPLLDLISTHIACDKLNERDCTSWIACAPSEAVFFRLLKISSRLAIDLAIDTQNGAGRIAGNRINCVVTGGVWPLAKTYHLATFVVVPNEQPRAVPGVLVMDFGNTGSSFIFHQAGQSAMNARPISIHNPFDPFDGKDVSPDTDQTIVKSNLLVLYVPESDQADPWLVMGSRAEVLIATQDPLTTSLFAPKKYVRAWEEHLKPQEPTTTCRGLVGQRPGLFPNLFFVKHALSDLLELVVSSLTNPHFASVQPENYPQVRQVLLTYPLTWREADKALFRDLVKGAAEHLFVLPESVRQQFQVELICSEPVAVAAHVLWETFFHFLHAGLNGRRNLIAPSLVSSLLGNTDGTQELRLLTVDIGGGSTDIAVVEANWSVTDDDNQAVDVRFRVVESLRFNRAGDRISHLMATAVFEYLRRKYGLNESLDFKKPSINPAFTPKYKREVVSKISEVVEKAKREFSRTGQPWQLTAGDEAALVDSFRSVVGQVPSETMPDQAPATLEISLSTLQSWVEADQASMLTRGEPGFMDIFYFLEELRHSLASQNRLPHLVVLSGRTTRLSFIRELTARHLELPLHRVRLVGELLPRAFQGPDHENIDKLAVVLGGHRVRFGDPIRFIPLSAEPIFNRYIGTISETPVGLKLNRVLIESGVSYPATVTIKVAPTSTILLGHAFRRNSTHAEVLASVANHCYEEKEIELDFLNDYEVRMKKGRNTNGVILTERVPGGTDLIVDNFNDTGQIDSEKGVEGLLKQIVLRNIQEWYKE